MGKNKIEKAKYMNNKKNKKKKMINNLMLRKIKQ